LTPFGPPGSLGAFQTGCRAGTPIRGAQALTALIVIYVAACATAVESGPPIANPADLAARVRAGAGAEVATSLRFDWRYADRRGEVAGQGVGRYNPPDSLRVDLFTSGDVAMAVALAGGELRSLGEIEDVELPPLPFVYAMAGMFRPGGGGPEAYEAGEDSVLVYQVDETSRIYFYIRSGRLRRVEEKEHGRTLQRVNVVWTENGRWPSRAEYRDLRAHSRVRWDMGPITKQTGRYPAQIFDLPPAP
jgi:hypothetical protein